MRVVEHRLCLSMLLWGCGTQQPPPVQAPAAAPSQPASAAPQPLSLPSAAPTPTGSAQAPAGVAPRPAFRACGKLECKAFASAADAFDFVLGDAPRVLAIGEAHAQSDGPNTSSTRRFMDGLLPHLAPRASDLVIELWLANGSCGKVEQQVKQQQSAVTAPQAATNQNEFVELGHRAKALGIMPHALVPSCEQYRKIAGAGAEDIEEMLTMIKSVTAGDVQELLAKRAPERLIVAYGGAMHNDLVPRAGREAFSFGPELAEATRDRYVELDLVIPEQIKDTEAWRALPWHPYYSRENAGSEAYLFSWAPHAFALIFPRAAEATP
jgi:hypothetical protein